MSESQIRVGRIVLIGVWIALAACFFVPLGTLGTIGRWAFGLMLLAHLAEFTVFRSRLEAAGGSLGHHFVQMLLFGILHVRSLDAAPEG